MGKVIKVIDLINMLAEFQNGVKVKLPRKIKINDIIYNFKDSAKMYFSEMIQVRLSWRMFIWTKRQSRNPRRRTRN